MPRSAWSGPTWVVLQRSFAVRRFDLVGGCLFVNPKNLIRVN